MVEARTSLYRLDFCADLTAAQAPVYQIGYLLEAAISDGARFLGLVSRRSLTRLELDTVDLMTWPELEDIDAFMDRLFNRAWDFVEHPASDDLCLGSELLSKNHSSNSALTFGKLDVAPDLSVSLLGDTDAWQEKYYQAMVDFGKLLKPTLTGEILAFAPKDAAVSGFDQRPELRLKAA